MIRVLKVGRQIDWDDIKIGEIFAYSGCWVIMEKRSKNSAMLIDCDNPNYLDISKLMGFGNEHIVIQGKIYHIKDDRFVNDNKNNYSALFVDEIYFSLYQLSEEIQDLWRG